MRFILGRTGVGKTYECLNELKIAMGVSIRGGMCAQDFGQELLTPMN